MSLEVKSKEKLNKDTVILLMGLFYPAVNNYIWRVMSLVTGIFGLTYTMATFDAIVWTAVILFVFLTSHKRTINSTSVAITISLVSVSLLSFALTDYAYFTSPVLISMLFGTFAFFIQGSWIDIKKVSQKYLYAAAVIVLFVSIAYSLYSLDKTETNLEDNMDFAYRVLPSVLVIFSRLFTSRKKVLASILSVIGAVFLILQGTRGPIVCIAVFVGLMLYKKYGFGKTFRRVGIVVLVSLIVLSSSFAKNVLLDVTQSIDKTGFSSRLVTMMIEGELADANGRDAIKDTLMEDIKEDPFAVRGMFADRHATSGLVDEEYNTSYETGTYAHSLILEMIYDWGIIFGGLMLLIILYLVLMIIKKCHKDEAYIVMMFVCTGFVYLFLSGSYLTSGNFFFLMGLAFSYCQHNKLKSAENNDTDKKNMAVNDLYEVR